MAPSKNSRMKIKWLATAAIMTCLMVVAIAATGNMMVYLEAKDAGEDWSEFESTTIQKSKFLSELRSSLGYGGMIHQFKNMVLRADAKRYEKVERGISNSRAALQGLRDLPLTPQERESLTKIESVVDAYAANAKKVVAYIAEGKTAVEIDKLVKISDKPALEGLNALSTTVDTQMQDQQVHVKEDTDALLDVAVVGGIATVVVLLFLSITLAFVFSLIMKKLGGEPDDVLSIANSLAEGKLKTSDEYRHKELKGALGALVKSVDHMGNVVSGIRDHAGHVKTEADQLAVLNADLLRKNEVQVDGIQATSSGVTEMMDSIKATADHALQAKNLASTTREQAEKGGSVVKEAVLAMQEINASSHKIGEIINVIDEIAFQTNLLALNAAVEAARAGDQGRGFAVVAGEVRNLAQRSASAAREITGLIQDSVSKVESGSKLVDESGSVLDEIVASAIEVSDLVADMSVANQHQASGVDGVTSALENMQGAVDENTADVQKATELSQRMNQQAAALERSVMAFDIAGNRSSRTRVSAPAVSSQPARPRSMPPQNPQVHRSAPKPADKVVSQREQKRFTAETSADDSWASF